MVRFTFALGIFVASACATQTSSQTQTASATPAKPAVAKGEEDPDELICEYERPTGSAMFKKVCFTRQEREDMMRTGQDFGGRRPRNNPFLQE